MRLLPLLVLLAACGKSDDSAESRVYVYDPALGNRCEAAFATIDDLLTGCGIQAPISDHQPCSDPAAEMVECQAQCYLTGGCEAVSGYDATASQGLASCLTGCL